MFTNEQLQVMIRQEVISKHYPYSEQDNTFLITNNDIKENDDAYIY